MSSPRSILCTDRITTLPFLCDRKSAKAERVGVGALEEGRKGQKAGVLLVIDQT